MNIPPKQNPFSLYDFLGYFIPGMFFWTVILYIDNLLFCSFITKHLHINKLVFYDTSAKNISDIPAITWVAILVFIYLSGHILALFSNITIEKFRRVVDLGKASGYLLGDIDTSSNKATISSILGIYPFKWSLPYFISTFVWITILIPELIFIFLIYYLKDTGIKETAKKIDQFYGKKPLDIPELAKSKLSEFINYHFKVSLDSNKIDSTKNGYFHYAYHYALEMTQMHATRMHNYVGLFGLCRNILMGSLLITIFILIYYIIFLAVHNSCPNSGIYTVFTMMLVCNFIFFYGYIKFERRYNEEVIFALSTINFDELKAKVSCKCDSK